MPDEAGLRNLLAVFIVHGVVAPRAVIVGRGEGAVRVQQRDDVALLVAVGRPEVRRAAGKRAVLFYTGAIPSIERTNTPFVSEYD